MTERGVRNKEVILVHLSTATGNKWLAYFSGDDGNLGNSGLCVSVKKLGPMPDNSTIFLVSSFKVAQSKQSRAKQGAR